MGLRVNPFTGQLEDDGQGMPQTLGQVQGVPLDQMQPAPSAPPGMLAANSRAGQDLSQPVVIDRGGNDGPPLNLPPQTPTAPPAPVAPQQPPGMVRDTETRTREVVSPEERKAMQALRATDQQGVQIAGQQGEVGQAQAQQKLDAANEQAGLRQQQAAETQARIAAGQAEAEKAKAQYDAESTKLSKMDMKDWWSTRSTGQTIVAAISLAMGAIGGALTGRGGNTALEVIDKAMDNDYRLQRAQIETQQGRVAGAEKNLHLTNDERARKLSELEVSQVAKWNALGDAAAAKAAQVGTQQAAVQAKVIKNAATEKAQAHYQEWLQGQRTKATSTSVQGTGGAAAAGGKPTEAQARYAMLAQQMNGELATIMQNPQMASTVLSKMQGGGQLSEAADVTASKGIMGALGVGAARGAGLLPKSKYEGLGQQEQLVANAWDNLTEKYARVLTGAGMPAEEARRMALQNSPHAGDSQAVIAQKLVRMKSASDQMMSLAGPAAASVAPAAPGAGGGAPGGSMSADDQAAVQWARSHPSDPRAARILQMHGM